MTGSLIIQIGFITWETSLLMKIWFISQLTIYDWVYRNRGSRSDKTEKACNTSNIKHSFQKTQLSCNIEKCHNKNAKTQKRYKHTEQYCDDHNVSVTIPMYTDNCCQFISNSLTDMYQNTHTYFNYMQRKKYKPFPLYIIQEILTLNYGSISLDYK